MITNLRLQNFKPWKDSGDIRLAPLTVLFGTNSSGKTSISQLLLLLKQTTESPDRKRALHLGDSRTLVDLGTYHDAIHNHDLSQPFKFSLGWNLNESLAIHDPVSGQKFAGDAIGLDVTIIADKRNQPTVQALEYILSDSGVTKLDVTMERRQGSSKYDLSSIYSPFVRHTGRAWPLPAPVRFYGFPDEATAYYQNTGHISLMALQTELLFRNVSYVGPLREYPKPLYTWSGELPEHVGVRGDSAIEAILAAGDRMFNMKPGGKTSPIAKLVAEQLREMGLLHEFKVNPLGPHRKEYEVLVRSGQKRPLVNLTAVGFGVSQVLPVIVECFYVPRKSIVIIEQPEIHLHPKAQADLADLFVDAIHARENGIPRECQFIIESHSEHFLRRLQRRIAEETLSAKDVALYSVYSTSDCARIETLDVDDYGNIRNWPKDFFGDEMADLVARSKEQARRSKS